jgi:hypothetical protein
MMMMVGVKAATLVVTLVESSAQCNSPNESLKAYVREVARTLGRTCVDVSYACFDDAPNPTTLWVVCDGEAWVGHMEGCFVRR